jgi:hypothetical protein
MQTAHNFNETPKTFRLTVEEKRTLTELAEFHKTTDSKILRAFLAIPQHYPAIHTAIKQFV